MVEEQCWRLALERHFPTMADWFVRSRGAAASTFEWRAAYKLCTLVPWKALAPNGKNEHTPMHFRCVSCEPRALLLTFAASR